MPVLSYTLLDTFETCPRQAHERFWLGRKFPMGPEAAKGVAVHKALEDYVTKSTPLPPELAAHQHLADAFFGRGEVRAEVPLAVNARMQPCGFWDHAAWLRGKLDVLVVGHARKTALVGDWKTGKPYEKELQHLICALLVLENYPSVETVYGFNLWLRESRAGKLNVYGRAGKDRLWADVVRRVHEIERAEGAQHWPERSGPLCAWCGVTECQNNRSGK